MAPSRNARRKKNTTGFTKQVNVGELVQRAIRARQEHKAFSTQVSGAIINPLGGMVPLTNGIVEGIDINQRSGTTIRMLRQNFRFSFNSLGLDQSARFIIFRDLFNTGTVPTVTEVLPTTGYLSHFSDVRMVQQKRYHILMDEMVTVSAQGPSKITKHVVINFKGNVYYNGPTGLGTANGKGAIFLLIIGSFNIGTYDYDWQGVYTDS